eukprot:g14117.t1
MATEVARVLSAKGHRQTLCLEGTTVTADELRRQYRKLALLVHPDKCSSPDAKAAFQKLSEAFEHLSAECHGERDEGGVKRGARCDSTGPMKRAKKRERPWWDTTWEECRRRFREQNAANRSDVRYEQELMPGRN